MLSGNSARTMGKENIQGNSDVDRMVVHEAIRVGYHIASPNKRKVKSPIQHQQKRRLD